MNKQDIQKIQDEIITAALPNVTFEGWGWPMLERASTGAGHSPAIARAVFPDKLKGALDHFADLADREMLKSLKDVDAENMPVRARISQALIARYTYLTPHKEAVRQGLQFWSIPTRKPHAAKIIWRTCDEIWDWAGDKSTDYNHYTKRMLLGGVMVSTTLAWINDESEDLTTTKAFLDRRIENVMQLGKVIHKLKKAS